MQTHTERREELAAVHDFAGKLLQPSLFPRLRQYVLTQAELRRRLETGQSIEDLLAELDAAPVSLNLDLTTACNYRCDHCVDLEILNTGIRYDHEKLKDSLRLLTERGLRSVIVIGGGEPTVYPGFAEIIRYMKGLGLTIGIVSNGSGNGKIAQIADCLGTRDWVRLSLDAGTDETFQAMHRPRKPLSLDQICEGVPPIKELRPGVTVGFSFIITWKGVEGNGQAIHENLHEMVCATELARRYQFDYISFKPFLTRAESNNAEVIGRADGQERFTETLLETLRKNIQEARKLETSSFRVIESTNLRVLMSGTAERYMKQPRHCHMQWFRQVISPLGLYNCPVYRNQPHGRIGQKHDYADATAMAAAQRKTLELVRTFDAAQQCKEVCCLYNHVNWFIEELIAQPERLEALVPGVEREDYFL